MAGSYRHIVDKHNTFIGTQNIDNLRDAYQALEECYLMILWLTSNDKNLIYESYKEGYLKLRCPPENYANYTYTDFWED